MAAIPEIVNKDLTPHGMRTCFTTWATEAEEPYSSRLSMRRSAIRSRAMRENQANETYYRGAQFLKPAPQNDGGVGKGYAGALRHRAAEAHATSSTLRTGMKEEKPKCVPQL